MQSKNLLMVFVVLVLNLCCALLGLGAQEATGGVLDLRNHDFSRKPEVPLSGSWDIWWKELLQPASPALGEPGSATPMRIPSTWNAVSKSNWGYATYRLRVLLPPDTPALALRVPVVAMAFRAYANGNLVAQAGTVGKSREDSESGWRPAIHLLPPQGEVLDLVYHVSNFDDQSGGLYNAPSLGPVETLYQARSRSILLDVLVFGALFMMGLYYLGLYLYRRRDPSSLYFALLCLSLCLRQTCYGEMVIYDVFPGLPFIVPYRAGYVLFTTGVASFLLFLREMFPSITWKKPVTVVVGLSLAYGLVSLLAPPWVFASSLMYYQLVVMFGGIFSLVVLIRGILVKHHSARLILGGFALLFAGAVHDMLKSYFAWPTPDLSTYGLLAFLFAQSLILTRKFAGAFAATERFANHLENLNQSLERFIPKEVLAFLKKDSVIDIKLGDHIEREMVVMFADIRDFTSLSEELTPRENFNFINSYLERMGPVIRKYEGFVDKYLGDGIMALFPGSPDQALMAVLELQATVVEYNQHRAKLGYRAIRVGYGVHVGNLMMGTIGESRRMDSTVISDTVNVASRLEGLTKKFGVDLMTSEAFIQRLEKPENFAYRFVSEEQVKGKALPIKVFEVQGLAIAGV